MIMKKNYFWHPKANFVNVWKVKYIEKKTTECEIICWPILIKKLLLAYLLSLSIHTDFRFKEQIRYHSKVLWLVSCNIFKRYKIANIFASISRAQDVVHFSSAVIVGQMTDQWRSVFFSDGHVPMSRALLWRKENTALTAIAWISFYRHYHLDSVICVLQTEQCCFWKQEKK